MSIFDGIFSPQTQTGFGNLMASGALGQLGAGLLSQRGTQGIMSGFGGASNAIARYQKQAALKSAVQQGIMSGNFSPQQQGILSALPATEALGIMSGQAFPKFNKDQQLLGALGDPSNPLNAAARTAYDLDAGADTQLTQGGLNFRHSTISADKAAGEAGQDRRQAAKLSQDEIQDIRSNTLARDKFAQDKFEFGQEYAIKQYRADLDGKKFDRGVLESDRDFDRGVLEDDRSFERGVLEDNRNFAQGVTEFDRRDSTTRRGQDVTTAGQGVTMRGQDMTAANAQAARQAAAAKEATPPASVREYEFYRNQAAANGVRPAEMMDFAQFKKAGGGSTNVTVNGEKKLTESQAKLSLFANTQALSRPVIDKFEESLTTTDYWRAAAGNSAVANAIVKTPEYRQYQAAASQWSEGALRIQTGAAATEAEIQRTMARYFPVPGDDAGTVEFKRQLRSNFEAAVSRAGSGFLPEVEGGDFTGFGEGSTPPAEAAPVDYKSKYGLD